jgi:hypothetical protein
MQPCQVLLLLLLLSLALHCHFHWWRSLQLQQLQQLQWCCLVECAAVEMPAERLLASVFLQPVAATSALHRVLLLPASALCGDLPSLLLLLPSCQESASADTDPGVVSITLL